MNSSHNRSPLEQLLELASRSGRPVVLDGALGTELDNRDARIHPVLWAARAALDNPSLVRAIHEEHVGAGSEIIRTATFRASHRLFLSAGETESSWLESIRAAASLAREAAGSSALVAGSIGPLADCFSPELVPSADICLAEHSLSSAALIEAGVDVLWLETLGTLSELEQALMAASSACKSTRVPVVACVTTRATGELISGESLVDALAVARDKGAAAFGVNCVPPDHLDVALECLGPDPALPLVAYPNLGMAEAKQDWTGSAYLEPTPYARRAARWFSRGARIIGACCGGTAAHLSALSREWKSVS